MTAELEVHSHSFISGPMSRAPGTHNFDHSHEDGATPHGHPDTGPGAYTIDKDEWHAETGLRGGGRKKFTRKPRGLQLELIPRERSTVKVIFAHTGYTGEYERAGISRQEYDRTAEEFQLAALFQQGFAAAGRALAIDAHEPGHGAAAVARMVLAFDMDVEYVYEAGYQQRLPL